MSLNIERTAFGLAVIESIWPHYQNGYSIQSPTVATKDGGVENVENMANPSNLSSSTRQEFTNYSSESRGYYRIIPMNILSFTTTTNVGGDSNFSLSFTMDDIILVGDSSGGIDGLRAIIPDVLAIAQGQKGLSLGQFERLNSLGLSAQRVSTPSSMFSIDDIVHTGDTVTLWFYNDPKDFPTAFESGADKTKDPIMGVILGSADRNAQYQTGDDDTGTATNFGSKLDIVARKAALDGTSPKANSLQLDSIAGEVSGEAIIYDWTNDIDLARADGAVGDAAGAQAGVTFEELVSKQDQEQLKKNGGFTSGLTYRAFNDQIYHRTAIYVSNNFYSGFAKFVPASNKAATIKYSSNPEAEQVTYFLMFHALIGDKLPADKQSDLTAIQAALDAVKAVNPSKPKFPGVTNGITAISTADARKYLAGRNIFSSIVQRKIKNIAETVEKPVAANKAGRYSRGYIKTTSHSETAYTVLKGHISSVTSTIRVGSGFEVSMSGGGLEYPMSKHMIFFDNNTQYSGVYNQIVDLPSRISQLNPAKAMVFLVNRWMPRQIKWGGPSQNTAAKVATNALPMESVLPLWLRRGNIILTKEPTPNSAPQVEGSQAQQPDFDPMNDSRVFTPIHFLNLTRMGEIIRAMEKADPNHIMSDSTMAYDIPGNTSVWQTCKKIAGSAVIFELFVDEIGNLMYRPSGEAWERASQPIETPIIFSEDIQSSTFTRSEDTVYTLVDIMPAVDILGASTMNSIAFNDFGRAVPRDRPVPINNGIGLNSTMDKKTLTKTAPEFYRYGLRYMQLSDFYGAAVQLSQSKAETILSFYKDPLKRAEISILGNPSYRIGNTVILHHTALKKRSSVMLRTGDHSSWLSGLSESQLLRFVSADTRLRKNEDVYSNQNFNIDDIWGGKPFVVNHSNVRDEFVATLNWISANVAEEIPADLFPTTLWYYLSRPDSLSKKVIAAYQMAMKMALGRLDRADESLVPYLRYVRLNNFLCASYYIEGVTHSYNQQAGESSTRLSLSYGQDNIALIHPANMVPVGHLSVERKMKDGYEGPDNSKATGIWRDFLHKYFEEQNEYKSSSFLYKAQTMRNTINYQHELAYRLGRN